MQQTPEQVRKNPAFAELVRRRTGFGLLLSVAMLVIYYGFVGLVAFAPGLMGTPVLGNITLGFPLGLLVILSAIALTGVYVLRANREYDPLTQRIKEGRP